MTGKFDKNGFVYDWMEVSNVALGSGECDEGKAGLIQSESIL